MCAAQKKCIQESRIPTCNACRSHAGQARVSRRVHARREPSGLESVATRRPHLVQRRTVGRVARVDECEGVGRPRRREEEPVADVVVVLGLPCRHRLAARRAEEVRDSASVRERRGRAIAAISVVVHASVSVPTFNNTARWQPYFTLFCIPCCGMLNVRTLPGACTCTSTFSICSELGAYPAIVESL